MVSGIVPLHTFTGMVDYATSEGITTYGFIRGIKGIWSYKRRSYHGEAQVGRTVLVKRRRSHTSSTVWSAKDHAVPTGKSLKVLTCRRNVIRIGRGHVIPKASKTHDTRLIVNKVSFHTGPRHNKRHINRE